MVARVGTWKGNNLQVKCGREAVKLINYYIKNDISFNQEITLSGKSIVRNIKKVRQEGFHVVMNYIGVDTPDIAKERVRIRVLKGGHGIPEDTIERRYYESLDNLKEVLDICNEINIYDNTNKFKRVAYICDGIIRWKRDMIPEWSRDILK